MGPAIKNPLLVDVGGTVSRISINSHQGMELALLISIKKK
jgi:hypothetical protein